MDYEPKVNGVPLSQVLAERGEQIQAEDNSQRMMAHRRLNRSRQAEAAPTQGSAVKCFGTPRKGKHHRQLQPWQV